MELSRLLAAPHRCDRGHRQPRSLLAGCRHQFEGTNAPGRIEQIGALLLNPSRGRNRSTFLSSDLRAPASFRRKSLRELSSGGLGLMPEEPTATETTRDREQPWTRMSLLERRLWFGGLIATLLFIGIFIGSAILCAGHHHRRIEVVLRPPGPPMWMRPPGYGGSPPSPWWGGPGGWGPGEWQGNPGGPSGPQLQQTPPPAPRG
jgi:hypothetical protein